MSNLRGLNQSDGGNHVLTITVGDGAAFGEQCETVNTDPAVRAARILLSGNDATQPGLAAILATVVTPVVAGLSGDVDDAVLELALSADVRLCEAGATFAITQPQRGELPSDGGTQRLPRIVGQGLASDMLLTGRRITAEEALHAGLVTEIVPADDVPKRTHEIATEIAAHGQAAGRFTKEAVIEGADMSLHQSLHLETDLAILLHTDPERSEGIDAFNERRKPRFRGEDEDA